MIQEEFWKQFNLVVDAETKAYIGVEISGVERVHGEVGETVQAVAERKKAEYKKFEGD